MPTFETPQPITVNLELGVGAVLIEASDRTDTIVEVRPSNAARRADVAAAAETRVELAGDTLVIRGPKGWRQYTFRGGSQSIDVEIHLPAGSRLRAETGVGSVRGTGRLGDCRVTTGIGEIRLDQAGPAQLRAGMGDVSVDRVVDHAELTTGSGAVRVGSVDGTAVVKNSNGDSRIGEVTGDLRVSAANGSIAVDHAHATVVAKTANGDIRLDEVARGAILAHTGCGNLDVAIRDGVAAWLDLDTHCGSVHNGLDDAQRPEPGEDAVEVRARSAFGDIAIRRAPLPAPSPQ